MQSCDHSRVWATKSRMICISRGHVRSKMLYQGMTKVMKLSVTVHMGPVLGLSGGGNTWECRRLVLSFENHPVIEIEPHTSPPELSYFRTGEGSSHFVLDCKVDEVEVVFIGKDENEVHRLVAVLPYVELWQEQGLCFSVRASQAFPRMRMG